MVLWNELLLAIDEAEGLEEVKIDLTDFDAEYISAEGCLDRFLRHGRFDLPADAPAADITNLTSISREDMATVIRIAAKLGLGKISNAFAALENTEAVPFFYTVPFVISQTVKIYSQSTIEIILNFLKNPEQFILFVKFTVETSPFLMHDVLVGIVDLWYEIYGKNDTGKTIQGWNLEGIRKLFPSQVPSEP